MSNSDDIREQRRTMWTKAITTAIPWAVIGTVVAAVLTLSGNIYKTRSDAESKPALEEQAFQHDLLLNEQAFRHDLLLKGFDPAELAQSEQYWDFLVPIQIIDTTDSS